MLRKLIDFIKKLLGLSPKDSSSSESGFTLIELLIVIAILGILAGGLLLAIDPAEKLRQGNDTRVINDVSQLASKVEQWTIQTGQGGVPGMYPSDQAAAWAAIGTPASPNATNYVYTYAYSGTATNTFTIRVDRLRSKKYDTTGDGTGNVRILYDSAKGKTCFVATTITACP